MLSRAMLGGHGMCVPGLRGRQPELPRQQSYRMTDVPAAAGSPG